MQVFYLRDKKRVRTGLMKKYLLLIEDEKGWEKFKDSIDKDINTEIIDLIQQKIKRGRKNDK